MSWSRLGPAFGLAVVVSAASFIVARQPVTAPWWLYADADATYSGSALDVMAGQPSKYFDHPGLVEQELLALTFGAASLAHGGPNRSFAFQEMLNLDRARAAFRGWAITFFVGGAALAFLLLGRLLGHWTWGVAGGLLWLAQPELPDTIQIRPDVLQAALALVVCFLCVRALERRSPLALAAAAAVLGFAMMVKLAAVALLAPLLVGSIAGYPGSGWPARLRSGLVSLYARHRALVLASGVLWSSLAIVSNLRASPSRASTPSSGVLPVVLFAAVDYGVACLVVRRLAPHRLLRRVFDPLYLVLALAFALGLAVPVGLLLGDGLQALSSVGGTLEGSNLNSGIVPFQAPFSIFESYPLLVPLVVFGLAGVAALVGVKRRSVWPALWFSGAAVAGVMAAARLGIPRYFALPYVLSIPPALWLLRARNTPRTRLLALALTVLAVIPTFRHSGDDAAYAARAETLSAAATQLADRYLKPGQVAIVPYLFPVPDGLWYTLLKIYTTAQPLYPYRFLADTPFDPAAELAVVQAQHLRVKYFIGSQAFAMAGQQRLHLNLGTYEARAVPGGQDRVAGIGIARLISGPGV